MGAFWTNHQTVLLAATTAAGLAIAIWLTLYNRTRRSGIPLFSRHIAADQSSWAHTTQTYQSTQLQLRGRPDYTATRGRALIPIEAKPLRHGVIRAGDRLQLGAYLLLLEEHTGQRPPYGMLSYQDQAWRIANTASLRREVRAAIQQIQEARTRQHANRNHHDRRRCRACSFNSQCDQALM